MDRYISARQVARRLGIADKAVPRVAAANGIRCRVIPGTQTRYSAADVDRLAEGCVRPAGPRAEQGMA